MVSENELREELGEPVVEVMRPGAKLQAGHTDHGLRKPVKEIDLDELEKLCQMQCTQPEIAAWFRVHLHTIEARRRDSAEFKEIMDRGYAHGRISIRRKQIQLLEAGGAAAGTMAVWLGKNILGQRDAPDIMLELQAARVRQLNATLNDSASSTSEDEDRITIEFVRPMLPAPGETSTT